MMLDGSAGPTFIHVAATLTQEGNRIGGEWHSLDATSAASGDLAGTVTYENSRQAITMRFTFAGPHPITTASDNCVGAARSEGQLVYNTATDTAGGAAPERPGWGIRLKAFEGITFESCPAIRYATWTLTRQSQ